MRRFLLVSLVLIAVPLTAKQAPQRMVFGVDFSSGRVLWQREAHRGAPPHPRHLKNSYASETPTTDGERVYVLFEMTMATPAIAQGNLIVRTAERLYRIGGK